MVAGAGVVMQNGAGEQVSAGEFDTAFFAAGHGVTADEAVGEGQMFLGQFNDRALGAANVGDNGRVR